MGATNGHHRPIILTYHSVNNRDCPDIYPSNIVSVENFRNEIKYLSREKNMLSLIELVDRLHNGSELNEDAVAITFDDGYHDFYTNAYPVLKEYEVPSTLFLVTGLLDEGKTKWDDEITHLVNNTTSSSLTIELEGRRRAYRLGSPQRRRRCISDLARILFGFSEENLRNAISQIRNELGQRPDSRSARIILSWREVKNLSTDGLVSFGAHTHSHINLAVNPLPMAEQEIASSKQELECELRRPCTVFSYPFGVFNDKIKKLVQAHHFSAAVTTIPGRIACGDDPFELKRLGVIDNAFKAFKRLLQKA